MRQLAMKFITGNLNWKFSSVSRQCSCIFTSTRRLDVVENFRSNNEKEVPKKTVF